MRRRLAFGALLLTLGSVARADQFAAGQYAGVGGPDATGSASSNGMQLGNVYAGSFFVSDVSTGQAFIAFTEFQGSSSYAGPEAFGGTLSSGGVGNQLAYLISQVMAPAELGGSPTNAEAAAIQLAIWQLTSAFVASSVTGDQTVLGLVNDITTLLGGGQVTGSPFSWIQPYSLSTTYDSSGVFTIEPSSGDSQALIGVDPPTGSLASAPEPSTLMFASLGVLAFAGYGWKRRKRS